MKLCNFIRINGQLYQVIDQAVDTERGEIVADITVKKAVAFALRPEIEGAIEWFLARVRPESGWKTAPTNPAIANLRRNPPLVVSSGRVE